MDHVQTIFLAGYLTLSGASTIFSMGLSPAFKSVLPKTAFATMMSAYAGRAEAMSRPRRRRGPAGPTARRPRRLRYKASVDLGKIPGPRWSNYAQQTLDSEYVAYVPLITAFVGVTFFVLACKPFLTAPHQARPVRTG